MIKSYKSYKTTLWAVLPPPVLSNLCLTYLLRALLLKILPHSAGNSHGTLELYVFGGYVTKKRKTFESNWIRWYQGGSSFPRECFKPLL